MSEYIIETQNLSKDFQGKTALNGLNLQIPYGGVHAIVGSNGAGKSTLFKILLGMLSPSKGQARILGKDSQDLMPQERGRIGFVNEEHTLPEWMTVANLTQMHRQQHAKWNQDVYQQMIGSINVAATHSVSQLSRGERAGLNLALVLAQSPDILMLDEPTLGLDVVAKQNFLNALLLSEAISQCTVIYCSHQMEEVERVASNLIILENGTLVNMSAPDDFCARVMLWIADFPDQGPAPESIPGLLQRKEIDGQQHYLVLDQDKDFARFLKRCGASCSYSMPVDLNGAVNGFLAQNHIATATTK